jgi:hypothetical protein
MSFAADASTKESAQIQASSILSRIEQAKNRGEVSTTPVPSAGTGSYASVPKHASVNGLHSDSPIISCSLFAK